MRLVPVASTDGLEAASSSAGKKLPPPSLSTEPREAGGGSYPNGRRGVCCPFDRRSIREEHAGSLGDNAGRDFP